MLSSGPQEPDHSYDLVLDLLRERLTAQSDRANTLDSKANGIMTIATTILATALVLQAALFAISATHSIVLELARLQWYLIVLLIVYLLTMISATISGYWLRKFSRAPEPKGLLDYATMPKLETQSFLVGTMTEVFYTNEKVIESKVWGMRIATLGLLLEIIALGVLLFMQTHN